MNLGNFLKKSMTVLLATTFMSASVVSLDTVQAHARPIKLRIGHPMAPGNNVTLGLEKLAELIEQKSDGQIKVEVYGNCILGSDRVTTEAAQAGTLDMSSSAVLNLASFHKDYMALDLPYMVSPDSLDKYYDAILYGELGEYYRKVAESVGLVPIMYSSYGFRNFVTTKKPINSIEDFQGLKVRSTDSPVDVATCQALGMSPTPTAWGEVYTALQQGTLDGESNTYALINDAKHTEVVKYAADTAHIYCFHLLLMNKKKWDSLTDAQRAIITEAAAEALEWQRAITYELDEQAVQAYLDKGIKFKHFTKEEYAQLYELTQPVRDRFMKELPAEVMELIAETQK